jgi:hypothetical protein
MCIKNNILFDFFIIKIDKPMNNIISPINPEINPNEKPQREIIKKMTNNTISENFIKHCKKILFII